MKHQLEEEIRKEIRNIPDGPISLFLSGGIDSSLVLALIKKEYPEKQIHTFSLARDEEYPDLVFARQIADIFGTEHHEIVLSDSEYEEYKREYAKIKEHNFKGDVNIYILGYIAREYSNIIVTGDGGDECFGGYWLHQYPVGHRETGQIKSFDEIHPEAKKHLKEMVRLGFRDFHFKDRSEKEDYDAVWEYFVEIMMPRHVEPLLNIAKVLNIDVYTPLFSENLVNFMRNVLYKERIDRKIERDLAIKYLPKPVIERESIGFDLVLEKDVVAN